MKYREETRLLGGKKVKVLVPIVKKEITEEEFVKRNEKILKRMAKRLEYIKKHEPEKYEELMKYVKMAQGEVV